MTPEHREVRRNYASLLEKMSDLPEPAATMSDTELSSAIGELKQFVETCSSVEKVLVEAMIASGYQSKGQNTSTQPEDGHIKLEPTKNQSKEFP